MKQFIIPDWTMQSPPRKTTDPSLSPGATTPPISPASNHFTRGASLSPGTPTPPISPVNRFAKVSPTAPMQANYIPQMHPWQYPVYYPFPPQFYQPPVEPQPTDFTFVWESGREQLSTFSTLAQQVQPHKPVQVKTEGNEALRRKYTQHVNCTELCRLKGCSKQPKKPTPVTTASQFAVPPTPFAIPTTMATPFTTQASMPTLFTTQTSVPHPFTTQTSVPTPFTVRGVPNPFTTPMGIPNSFATPFSTPAPAHAPFTVPAPAPAQAGCAHHHSVSYSQIPSKMDSPAAKVVNRASTTSDPVPSFVKQPSSGQPSDQPSDQPPSGGQPSKAESPEVPLANAKQHETLKPMSGRTAAFTKKQNAHTMVLPIAAAAELFFTSPYFMGSFGTHGQEVHMAAVPCTNIYASDRRWPNPRKDGVKAFELDPEFRESNPNFAHKPIALWRERIYCRGKHGCNPNPTAENARHKNCAVEIVCTIWAFDPDQVEIRYMGEHGPKHKPPPRTSAEYQKILTPEIDNFIKQQMVIDPFVTPTQLHVAMATTLKNVFSKYAVTPTLQQVTNRVCYLRKRTHLNETDCQVLHSLLDEPEVQPYVLYPKKREDYPSPKNPDWLIVFADQSMLQTIDRFGREIVGLDGNFKFTKYRIPFWSIVAEDDHHNAVPGAFIVGSRDNGNILGKGLRIVAENVPKGGWNPHWTIDKDDKEYNAIREECKDLFTKEVFLCHFHGLRTWKKQLMAKVQDPRLRIELMARILFIQRSTTHLQSVGRSIDMRLFCKKHPELSDFMSYFEENWLCSRWRKTWIDVARAHRWGLYNTNNFSETTFRKLGRLFFQNKLRMSLYKLFLSLINVVMPYYKEIRLQKDEGRIPVRASQQERTEEKQKENAQEILDTGLIGICKCTCESDDKCKCGMHDDLFKCRSQRNEYLYYLVNLYTRTCTCVFFGSTGRICKHLFAAILLKQASSNSTDGLVRVEEPASPEDFADVLPNPIEPKSSKPAPRKKAPKSSTLQRVTDAINNGKKDDPATVLANVQNLLEEDSPNEEPTSGKTPFSPEHPGRPATKVDRSFRIKTHKKRGPKAKHTLDGVDRQNPANPEDIIEVTNKRGSKNVEYAVKWRNGTTSWIRQAFLESNPRLVSLYEDYLITKEEAKKAKRRQYDKARKAKKNSANTPTPTDPEQSTPIASPFNAFIESPASAPRADNSATPNVANAENSTSPTAEKGVTTNQNEFRTPPKPQRKRKVRSPQSPVGQITTKRSQVNMTTPERRICFDFPVPTDIRENHPLCSAPCSLSRHLIRVMRDTPHIELVPLDFLAKCVEFDRAKHPKYTKDDPKINVGIMAEEIDRFGVGEEILLHHSLVDRKVYVIEGNLRIAAAKQLKTIQYLPARVVAAKSETPRRVGMIPPTPLPRTTKGTHFPPSALGITGDRPASL